MCIECTIQSKLFIDISIMNSFGSKIQCENHKKCIKTYTSVQVPALPH